MRQGSNTVPSRGPPPHSTPLTAWKRLVVQLAPFAFHLTASTRSGSSSFRNTTPLGVLNVITDRLEKAGWAK